MISQLFILLTQLKVHSMKLMNLMLSFFLPIQGILIMVGFAILIDTITGIWKSIKNGDSITSRKLSAFISKTLLYESTILLFFLMDSFILNDVVTQVFSIDLLTTKCVALVLVSIEIVSINENYKSVMNVDLWHRAKLLISRIKEVKQSLKDIKDIK